MAEADSEEIEADEALLEAEVLPEEARAASVAGQEGSAADRGVVASVVEVEAHREGVEEGRAWLKASLVTWDGEWRFWRVGTRKPRVRYMVRMCYRIPRLL